MILSSQVFKLKRTFITQTELLINHFYITNIMMSNNLYQSDHPSVTTNYMLIERMLRKIWINFLVACVLIMLSPFKNQIYKIPYEAFHNQIYLFYLLFILSVSLLKMQFAKSKLLNYALFLLLNASLIWIILYQCGRNPAQKGLLLNTVAALFGAGLGLDLYVCKNMCDFRDSVDFIGGMISSSIGVILSINAVSYLFETFQIFHMAFALTLSILFSVSLMKISNQMLTNYQQAELADSKRCISIYFWSLPRYIFHQLTWLLIQIKDYEYL